MRSGDELLELRGEVGIPPQDLGRLDRVGEQVADDLVVHRRAHDEPALLGGVGRPADQPAGLRVLDEEIHEEQRGVLHDRVGPIREELTVAGVEVVVPEVVAEPGAAGDPDAVIRGVDGGGAAPEVGVVVQDPAARAVVFLRDRPARLGDIRDEVEERARAFREVRDLDRPVVHLGVDVHGPLAVPGGIERLVPDALQVRGLAAGAAAGDHQVAAELEEEGGQRGVVLPGDGLEPSIGGQPGRLGRPQVERHAPEQALVVGDVGRSQAVDRLAGGRGQGLLAPGGRVGGDVLVALEVRRAREHQRDGTGSLDRDPVGPDADLAALGDRPEAGLEADRAGHLDAAPADVAAAPRVRGGPGTHLAPRHGSPCGGWRASPGT